MISLLDYERFKVYQKFLENENLSRDNVNNSNEGMTMTMTLNEDLISIQQIKKMSETILSLIKGKLEYEFIYDYFGDNKNLSAMSMSLPNKLFSSFGKNGFNLEMQELQNDNEEDNNFNNNYNHDNNFETSSSNDKEFEVFLKVIESLSRYDLNSNNQNTNKTSIFDLLPLTSNEFLKNKVKLDDEEIKDIKGKYQEQEDEIQENINQESINDKNDKNDKNNKNSVLEETPIPIESPPKKILENILNTSAKKDKKPQNSSLFLTDNKKSHTHTQPKEISSIEKSIEKEMEEDLNNEIFSYTRNMKHYASSFNEILQRDNKKLDTIEKNQEGSKTKTDRSMKSLKEFSSTIRIGFFKLLLMLIAVGVTFMLTLLSIRIFPKLA
jgi:hypothetical protein